MTNFVEKLIENELPTSGFKPFVQPRDLLREELNVRTAYSLLKPSLRGFYAQSWNHGNELKSGEQSFSVEFSDRIKLSACSLRPKLIFQNGSKIFYRASLGVDMGDYGDLEVTHQIKNSQNMPDFEINHYFSKYGLNAKTSLTAYIAEENSRPKLSFSSLYKQKLEIYDRKALKVIESNTIYGLDASVNLFAPEKLDLSGYYQAKTLNYDFILAFVRKAAEDKPYNTNIIAGMKYAVNRNKKLLAKMSYNLDDKVPQVDVMIRNKHLMEPNIKTFHKISSLLKAGSGFTVAFKNLKLHALAEVSLLNKDPCARPFCLSMRIETNGDKKPFNIKKK